MTSDAFNKVAYDAEGSSGAVDGKAGASDVQNPAAEGPTGFSPAVVRQAFGSQTLSAYSIMLESWRRRLKVVVDDPRGVRFAVTDGVKEVRFNGSRSSKTTSAAIRAVDDKHVTIKKLQRRGVPVPKSELILTADVTPEGALEQAKRDFTWPVVLKPVRGSQGKGVFANIDTDDAFLESYRHLLYELKAPKVLLEEHAFGEDYRVYVVGDKAVAACRRVPAHVVGDGVQTVSELISAKNRLRRKNPFLSKGLIRPDVETDRMLEHLGLTYDSVPVENDFVQLRQKANASAGGDVEDVTNELPSHVMDAAGAAVDAVEGLEAAGVDILLQGNPSDPTAEFVVIELNARAHIGVNMYPTRGEGQDVPKAIIDHFFPASKGTVTSDMNNLAINAKSILLPLKEGAARQVEVSALPEHLYPCREFVRLPQGTHITVPQRRALQRTSRKSSISGALQHIDGRAELVIAGRESDVNEYLEYCEKLLGISLSPERWQGTVLQGFVVTDERFLF